MIGRKVKVNGAGSALRDGRYIKATATATETATAEAKQPAVRLPTGSHAGATGASVYPTQRARFSFLQV
jgi:hypothetical protein